MTEKKGFARFRVKRTKEPKFYEVEVGNISVDAKVHARIKRVMNKYSDQGRFGPNAIKTEGEAVAVLLEHFVYNSGKKNNNSKKVR